MSAQTSEKKSKKITRQNVPGCIGNSSMVTLVNQLRFCDKCAQPRPLTVQPQPTEQKVTKKSGTKKKKDDQKPIFNLRDKCLHCKDESKLDKEKLYVFN